MKLTSTRIAIATVLLVFIANPARADLSPGAREAVNEGNVAWKKQDYLQAVGHYQDALKIAPDAPEIFGDLGLAESNIPGREMRAICWFSAYLAANPNAANAAAVKQQIVALNVKSHSNCAQLIHAVQLAAQNLPTQATRDHGYLAVARLLASIGDYAAAQKIADKIVGSDDKSDAESSITGNQISDGDLAGAQKTVALIPSDYWKNIRVANIAVAQAQAGDIAGAQKNAALVTTDSEKSEAGSAIALAQAKADGVEAWKKLVESNPDVHARIAGERDIALAEAKAGDLPGAKATLQDALKNTEQETVAIYKDSSIQGIAIAHARIGDIAGAQETANLITADDAGLKEEAGSAIAAAQAMAGDIPAAQKTASSLQSVYFQEAAGNYIAQAQAKAAGNPAAPLSLAHLSEWLAEVGKFGLNLPLFLDPVGYLKTLPTDDPGKTFDALDENVGNFVNHQAIVDHMLKIQAQQ